MTRRSRRPAPAGLLHVQENSGTLVFTFAIPGKFSRYVVEKGSIAVDGVSLTVSALSLPDAAEQWFEVSLIPETLKRTTLGSRKPADTVNLEVDVIAKHVERLLIERSPETAEGAR